MIKATDDELTLVFGLLLNPVMIPDYSDFKEHELNTIPYKLIKYLREYDFEKILNSGAGLIPIFNLKRRKIITDKEAQELIHMYGEYPTAHCYINECYLRLKQETKKRLLYLKLNSLDLSEDNNNIREELQQAITLMETESDEYMETIKEVEPRCNNTQKSLVVWNNEKMQNKVAIDSNYLVVIGARPGTGKTTFSVKLAMENSKNSKIIFYSLEMSKEQITRKAKHYGGYYHKDNVYIKQSSCITIADISRDVRKYRPKFVIIDQLNKVYAEGKTELEKLTNAIRSLKVLAVSVNTPMIVLHQINRSAEEGKKPFLHNLKGSGAVEEESDVILLLSITENNTTTVYCDKNRSLNGYIGKFDFSFEKSTNLYREL